MDEEHWKLIYFKSENVYNHCEKQLGIIKEAIPFRSSVPVGVLPKKQNLSGKMATPIH